MYGKIISYQKCPKCGKKFKSSDGDYPIECSTCKTQPTKFQVQIYFQGKCVTVSRDREGKTIHSFKHARIVLDAIRAERKNFDPNVYLKISDTNFETFWNKFLKKYEDRTGTHDKIKAVGEYHILPFFRNFQMRDIRAYHIDEWFDELKKKEFSPKYLNDILQWLKRFFTQAKNLDIVEKIPHFPDTLSVPESDTEEYYTEQEQLKILNKIPIYDRAIFDFLFLTGCRIGEGIGLQKKDTDFNKGITIIKHTIKRDGTIGITKNKKNRIIPHFPELISCLKITSLKSQFQFTNKWGRKYSGDYLRDTFNDACIEADIPIIKLKNATRHSFGMSLISKGHDFWKVSKAMGHSTTKMTENYVKILATQLQNMYGRDKQFLSEISLNEKLS